MAENIELANLKAHTLLPKSRIEISNYRQIGRYKRQNGSDKQHITT